MPNLTGGSVVWNFDVDDKKFKAGLASAKNDAKAFGKDLDQTADRSNKFSDGLTRVGSAASKAGVMIIAAGTAFALLSKNVLSSTSDFQQSRIAFDTMLGSAEAGRKIMAEIADFAKRTPFNLPQVVEGAKSLLAYGIAAEKLLPTFNALGNIAAGVGKDKLPQLTLAFGQVRAAGKLTGAELRQFTESGVPLLEVLGQQAGKTAGQIKQEMEEGAAPSFAEVEKAIFSMSQNGGKFFGLMEKQSQTFGGRIANIMDSAGMIIRGVLGVNAQGDVAAGSVFDKLTNSAEKFMTFLEKNQGKIIAAITKVFEFIDNYGAEIAIFVGVILTAAFTKWAASVIAATWPILLIAAGVTALFVIIKKLIPVVVAVKNKFVEVGNWFQQTFANQIERIGNIFDIVRDAVVRFGEAVFDTVENVIKKAIDTVTPYFRRIADVIEFLAGPVIAYFRLQFSAWKAIIETVASAASTAFDTIKKAIEPVVDIVKNSLGAAFREIKDAFNDAKNSLGLLKDVLDPIKESLNNVKQPLIDLKNEILNGLVVPFNEFKKVWNENIKPAIAELVTLWQTTLYPAFQRIKEIWDKDVKPALTQLWQMIDGPVLTALKVLGVILLVVVLAPIALLVAGIVLLTIAFAKVIEWGAKLIGWFIDFQVEVLKVTALVAKFVAGIIGKFIELQTKVTAAIWGLVIDISNFFASIPGRILGFLGNARSILYDFGRDIIQGFLNGAESILKTVGKFFLDKLPSFIREPFKRALGIASPSKIFAGFGENIGQGLVKGINRSQGLIEDSINTMGNVTVSAAAPSMASGMEGSTGDSTGNAVINQTNNIYQQVDMQTAFNDLAWRLAN